MVATGCSSGAPKAWNHPVKNHVPHGCPRLCPCLSLSLFSLSLSLSLSLALSLPHSLPSPSVSHTRSRTRSHTRSLSRSASLPPSGKRDALHEEVTLTWTIRTELPGGVAHSWCAAETTASVQVISADLITVDVP